MTSDQFAYWLQGFFEMTDSKNLSERQVSMIKEHLKLVFNKVTPDIQPSPLPGLTKEDIEKALEKGKKIVEETEKRWSSTRSKRLC